MIHRIKEGEEMRWGLNVGEGYICVKFYRRFRFWFGRHYGLGWWLDLTRDHRMYRPNDADSPYLQCRRCGQSTALRDTTNYCAGKTYWRRPKR